jgi:hypothetical protein
MVQQQQQQQQHGVQSVCFGSVIAHSATGILQLQQPRKQRLAAPQQPLLGVRLQQQLCEDKQK